MKTIAFGMGVIALTASAAFGADAKDYTVAFPCKATTSSQTVKAGKMQVPVTSRVCDNKHGQFTFAASDFPKSFIAKKTLKAAFADAVAGAAANVGGTVRTDKPVMVGGVAGHDAVIDVKKAKVAVRLRVFFVRDREYQVVFVGPAGQENGKAATDFLGSFRPAK